MVEPFLKRRPIKGWVVRLGSSSKRRLPCLRHSLHGDRWPRRSNQGENASDRFDRRAHREGARGESLGLSLGDEAAAAEGTTVPVSGKAVLRQFLRAGTLARCWS